LKDHNPVIRRGRYTSAMSKQVLDARCPGCGEELSVNVEIPEAKEIVRVVTQEDSTKVNRLSTDLAESQRTVEALRDEAHRWQTGENHLRAASMLHLLTSCPNCKATLDAFVDQIRQDTVSSLSVDQVKEIARAQRWWPPPPLELVTRRR
jgi:hypothetical protein